MSTPTTSAWRSRVQSLRTGSGAPASGAGGEGTEGGGSQPPETEPHPDEVVSMDPETQHGTAPEAETATGSAPLADTPPLSEDGGLNAAPDAAASEEAQTSAPPTDPTQHAAAAPVGAPQPLQTAPNTAAGEDQGATQPPPPSDAAAAAAPQQQGAAAAAPGHPQPPGKSTPAVPVPPDVPDAPPVKPEDAPAIILQALLNRLSALDQFSFFQAPVTEAVAPGYFTVVKRPMCFQDMRAKLKRRAYRTWRQLVDDFDLICSNAILYNRKNSKIHKAAQTLNRAGKKMLQNSELEGRKAVQLLHPDGPHAATREDEAEGAAQAAASGLMSPTSSSCLNAALKAEALAGAEAERLQDSLVAYEVIVDELLGPGSAAAPEPAEGDGYSSFSDTDTEEPNPAVAAATPDPLLQPSLPAVSWIPFKAAAAGSRKRGREGQDGVKQEEEPKEEKGAQEKGKEERKEGKEEDPGREAVRRGLEWRHRWLELRCRELKAQEERQAALVARLEAGSSPAAEPQASGQQQQQGQQPAASLAGSARCRLPHQRKPRRQQQQALGSNRSAGSRPLKEVPFFAHQAYGLVPGSGPGDTAGSSGGGRSGAAAAGASASPSKDDGAAVFASLELLSGRLQVLKAALGGGQQRGSRVKRQPSATDVRAAARARGGAAAALSGQRSPTTQARGYRGAAPSAIAIPSSRADEQGPITKAGSGRKRSKSDAWDPETPIVPLPKIADRPPVADIYTPSVRLIDETELQRRNTAVAVLREKAIAEAAASMQPGLVVADANGDAEALLADAVGSDGAREGSSSEETDDECYLRRHQEMEEKERAAISERAGRGEGRRSSNTDTSNAAGARTSSKGPNGGLPSRIGSPKGT